MNAPLRIGWLGGLLAVLPFVSGCVYGVAWLPDSSGFIYNSSGKREVRYFDVASGKSQVLVKPASQITLLPAIRPDGKQFALAASMDLIILYDRNGEEAKRASPLKWNVPDGDGRDDLIVQFWSPAAGKILVQGSRRNWVACAIYDIKADRFSVFEDTWPLIFGTTPIRPDGQGFLAMKGDFAPKGVRELAWIDWDGKQTKIKAAPEILAESLYRDLSNMPFLFDSRWDKDHAIVRLRDQQTEIDTKAMTAVLKKVEALKEGDDYIQNRFQFPDSKVQLRSLVSEAGDKPRLELLEPGQEASGSPPEYRPDDAFTEWVDDRGALR